MFPIDPSRPSTLQIMLEPQHSTSQDAHNALSAQIKTISNTEQSLQMPQSSSSSTSTVKFKRPVTLNLNLTKKIQFSEFDQLRGKTSEMLREKNVKYDTEDRGQRYISIESAKATQIKLKSRSQKQIVMPANRLYVNENPIAIRCQYPQNDAQSIENHLRMLIEQKTPLLVVLASQNEMDFSIIRPNPLPSYFEGKKKYGSLKVNSIRKRTNSNIDRKDPNLKKEALRFNQYEMNIIDGKMKFSLPVLHVTNWNDGGALSVSDLRALARVTNCMVYRGLLTLRKKNIKVQGANRPLPIIHCKAGVGRTGVLIAAMQLVKRGNKHSAQKIVLGLRESGNPTMIQNESQYNTLLALNKMLRDKKSPSKGGE